MTIYFDGCDYRYEMENVARLFFPLHHFSFDVEQKSEEDYLRFVQQEEQGEALLLVAVKIGSFYKEQTSVVTETSVPLEESSFENQCEEEFARLLFQILEEYTGVRPKWGILTGIRPVKRMQHSLDTGHSPEEANAEFRDKFLVSEEKIRLSARIIQIQQPVLKEISPKDFSLYIAIPYCPTRCSYCSFVSHSITQPKAKKLIPAYVECLVKEINFTAKICREIGIQLRSVYIGGGTPTALEAEQLKTITDAVRRDFDPSPELEYTIEAGRADTVTREKLQVIFDSGANRVSINPQTFEDSVLKAVGRPHTAEDVERAYHMAREYGFSAINMDLIAGLPTDTVDGFRRSLDRAVSLGPENITVHTLTVKRAAELYTVMDGSEDYTAVQQMVDYSGKTLMENGYLPYYLYRQKNTIGNLENVGYAKPGHFGLYNIYIMEEVQNILALGAGGVSKVVRPGRVDRVFNYKYPYEYISRFPDILSRKEAVRSLLTEGGASW